MKKIFLFFLFAFLFTIPVHAQESIESKCFNECIRIFNTNVDILKSGEIKVEERIEYDFSTSRNRHGIFRELPFTKTNLNGRKDQLDFDIQAVIDEEGQPYEYERSFENEMIKLKIGDADTTVSGVHTYIIRYTVRGALTYFSDHDELYWNITGNGWDVPIIKSTATINIPTSEPLHLEKTKAICYTGEAGATEQNCTYMFANDYYNSYIFSADELLSRQGFTTVVSFPKGIVEVLEPREYKTFFETPAGIIALAMIGIAALVWYILLPIWIPIKWFLHGRDPKGKNRPVSAWYDPPQTKSGRDLTPAEIGTLVDEKSDLKDISGMIVHLAQRGFFKIVEKKEEDFYFVKEKDFARAHGLLDFEKVFLEEVFGDKKEIRIKDQKLHTTISKINTMLYEGLVKEGFFPTNPEKTRILYSVLGGFALFTFNYILALVAFVFGWIMPKKTVEGVEAANIGKSMKNFLGTQERQLEFQAKNQMFFEKLLPFAIVFGAEKIWAERFKDITLAQPDWYKGYGSHVYSPVTFTNSLDSSFSSFKSAATPTTSSSGYSSGFSGGSSGGGGGGGGGGSW